MITMMTTKDDEQRAQENQEQVKSSRIKKNSRFKKKAYKQESRFKTQDSRMKKRLNQDKY